MTKNLINEDTKLYLEIFLPDALSATMSSYNDYILEKNKDKKPEEFIDNHKALKLALGNIETLLKIMKLAPATSEKSKDTQLKDMLKLAKDREQENQDRLDNDTED